MSNHISHHSLLELVRFHEQAAQQVCLTLCSDFLPQAIADDSGIADHIAVERMLAKRLLRTAGFLRVILHRVLEVEKQAKIAGLDSEFTAILNNAEVKKQLRKIMNAAETFW